MSQKEHWENVYTTKTPEEVSWTQVVPKTSLELIQATGISKEASIIDVGGGDSNLVDFLLDSGYTNLTVLDISESALKRAQTRLGDKAQQVKWIVSDSKTFQPTEHYAVWHDRAAFHFITDEKDKLRYVDRVAKHVTDTFILGTFSENGPMKCSGLEISQYNELKLNQLFGASFDLNTCFLEDHTTPFNTIQNFIFCSFKRRYSCC
jgi:ubiquinone/menaquinone biosynthesis C-methylase UbiE